MTVHRNEQSFFSENLYLAGDPRKYSFAREAAKVKAVLVTKLNFISRD